MIYLELDIPTAKLVANAVSFWARKLGGSNIQASGRCNEVVEAIRHAIWEQEHGEVAKVAASGTQK